ncbi:MAG: DUF1080 domain-containing protein [Thermoguttaceae bacterium]|nr:DUF1080 domain-containing protein [Thermoguttaceae bacterium]
MKKLLSLLAVAALGCGAVCAQEFTSVEQVAKDGTYVDAFNIQGEYLQPSKNRGFQVIARGADKFDVVGYQDGLPGNGWDRSKARFFGTGELVDGKLVVTGQKMDIPRYEEDREIVFTDEQKATQLIATYEDGKYILDFKGKSELEKVVRESPTLGEKAPEGAVVIFDGTNVDGFEPGAKLNKEAKSLWSEACTKPFEKGPFTLHVEFMLSFMPNATGQGRSNSGVYICEAYECQVLDSFGLNGENNECGGFYQFKEPGVNMCFPPLTWQTYDFDVTPAKFENGKQVSNAKVTLRHNGVEIYKDLELTHETPGRKKVADEPRGLYLQGHGNHVQYRNIWVKYNK